MMKFFTIMLLVLISLYNSLADDAHKKDQEGVQNKTKRENKGDYRYGYNLRLATSMMRQNENYIRQIGLVKLLGSCQGPEAQALRILLWSRLKATDLRVEVIEQWINGRESKPNLSGLKSSINNMPSLSPSEQQKRWSEIIKIISSKNGKAKDIAAEMHAGKGSGSKTLDYLVDDSEPFGVGFMTANKNKKATFYRNMPDPENYEDGDETSIAIYSILYSLEADKEIKDCLRNKIKKAMPMNGNLAKKAMESHDKDNRK